MTWTHIRLSDVIEKPLSGEWGDGEGTVKVLRTTNFTNDGSIDFSDVVERDISNNKVEQKKLKPGDTIIEKSGGSPNQPVGRVVYFEITNETFLCNNFTSVLRPKPEIDGKYLFWFLFNNHVIKNTLKYQNKTTGIINLQLERYLSEIQIPLPSLATQKRIAKILDKADALRRKDQELLAKYDELAQAIFIDMFGDPVRNEKGWEMKNLGDLSDHISSGSTPLGGSSVYQEHGIKFIRSQNIQMSKIEYEKMICISNEIHDSMKRTWVKSKDVLLNITGASIGRVAVYEGDDNQANVNQHVCIIRTKKNLLNPYFLMELIASKSFQRKSISSSAGGTREAFTFDMIKQFSIIYPPIKYQNRFQSLIENLRTQSQLQKRNYSESLFDSLLQKAFSGELIA